MAKIFYPEEFNELDPEAELNEFFDRFMLLDSDITTWFMAVVIGASLGIGGCEIQTILRNPIVSQFTLGISAAASFGAAMGLILNVNLFHVSDTLAVTVNSFVFSLLVAGAIYLFSRQNGIGKTAIILFGIGLKGFFLAVRPPRPPEFPYDEPNDEMHSTTPSPLHTATFFRPLRNQSQELCNNFKNCFAFYFKALYSDNKQITKKGKQIMSITIEIIPSYRIAYIREVGPYGTGNALSMEKLKNWAKSKSLFNDKSIILGIAQDNPETTKPENCRYDTCIVVSDDYCVDKGYVNEGNIIGGSYAIFKISHTAEAIQKAWIEIFPELLKEGYQFDETRPVLERYIAEMVNNHYCEICVPIH